MLQIIYVDLYIEASNKYRQRCFMAYLLLRQMYYLAVGTEHIQQRMLLYTLSSELQGIFFKYFHSMEPFHSMAT